MSCGIDNDSAALKTADALGAYRVSVCGDGVRLPFRTAAFKSVVANSVLEHTDDPASILKEFRRVLSADGTLAFTVPTPAYTRFVRKYLGKRESSHRNWLLGHQQMHEPTWWHAALATAGFSVEMTREHAPDWFVLAYLAMSTGVGSRLLKSRLGSRWQSCGSAAALVRSSIDSPQEGANVFILARVRP